MPETVFTHDLPAPDPAAVIERLRRVDGTRTDAAVVVWEQCRALVAEFDRLRAEVAASQLQWSEHLPTATGWYWLRSPDSPRVRAVEIAPVMADGDGVTVRLMLIERGIAFHLRQQPGQQFAGPIPQPRGG